MMHDDRNPGAARHTLLAEHGHWYLEPREGGDQRGASQGRVHLCRRSPRYD